MSRYNYNKSKSKPEIDIDALVAAIKDVMILNEKIRAVGRSYNIDKSRLSRYISQIKEADLDPLTVSNDEFTEFVSSLCGNTRGKTVCSFCFLNFKFWYYTRFLQMCILYADL